MRRVNYSPNFNDPKVQRRCARALTWAQDNLYHHLSIAKSQREIRDVLGAATSELHHWLRDNLLICTDQRYHFDATGSGRGQCKKYRLNREGYCRARELLAKASNSGWRAAHASSLASQQEQDNNRTTQQALLHYSSSQVQETSPNSLLHYSSSQVKDKTSLNTLLHYSSSQVGSVSQPVFHYRDHNNRLWNGLQCQPRARRGAILAQCGLTWDYDIEAAAPTLLLQHARSLGLTQATPALDSYLRDRQGYRQRLAQQLDLTTTESKLILAALVNGARLTTWHQGSILALCRGDRSRILWLQQDPEIRALQRDISAVWRQIGQTLPRRRIINRLNRLQTLPLTAGQRAAVYFQLERQVLDAARKYLELTDNPVFLIHDGWVTRDQITLTEIEDYITLLTGYTVKIEESQR